jgi:hypothetical protein
MILVLPSVSFLHLHIRASPRAGTARQPLAGTGSAHCSQRARIHPKFLHQHHYTLPIIASFTPKIPSANLFFQPHPPNTEKARLLDSSTVLWRATPKRPPFPVPRPLLMRALALRNVCRGVGRAIYQATLPQELFPVLLAVARGNALRGCQTYMEFLGLLGRGSVLPLWPRVYFVFC